MPPFQRLSCGFLGLILCFPPLTAIAESGDGTVRHVFPSLDGSFVAERVLEGLSQPAALEFLPDGRLLVAQRDRGVITVADLSAGSTENLAGLPPLVVHGDRAGQRHRTLVGRSIDQPNGALVSGNCRRSHAIDDRHGNTIRSSAQIVEIGVAQRRRR